MASRNIPQVFVKSHGVGKRCGAGQLQRLLCGKKKWVDAVIGWIDQDRDQPTVWQFSQDGIRTTSGTPELEQWFAWRGQKTAVLPTEWRKQPLKQLVTNRTLDFVEHTYRLRIKKDYQWASEFNATQLALIGWIDGSE